MLLCIRVNIIMFVLCIYLIVFTLVVIDYVCMCFLFILLFIM